MFSGATNANSLEHFSKHTKKLPGKKFFFLIWEVIYFEKKIECTTVLWHAYGIRWLKSADEFTQPQLLFLATSPGE